MSSNESMVKIVIPGGSNAVYTNKNDRRGQWLIRKQGMTQPLLTSGWRKAVQAVNPTLVIDVGLNYGEIMFSTNYNKGTKIIGIEANQDLAPYINKTLSKHPNNNQMQIIYALASDKVRREESFYVDPTYSGTSSAVPGFAESVKERKIRSIRLDFLFNGIHLDQHKLLFKIDVEGYEGHVLKGMCRLIQECAGCMGWIEFNTSFLGKAGTDITEFLSFLATHFTVYYPMQNELIQVYPVHLDTISKYVIKADLHTNLLLATNKEMVASLGYNIRTNH